MRDRDPRKPRAERYTAEKFVLTLTTADPPRRYRLTQCPPGPAAAPPHAILSGDIQIYLVIQRARHAAGVAVARGTRGVRGCPARMCTHARVDTRG